jgi:hypothetical protein
MLTSVALWHSISLCASTWFSILVYSLSSLTASILVSLFFLCSLFYWISESMEDPSLLQPASPARAILSVVCSWCMLLAISLMLGST